MEKRDSIDRVHTILGIRRENLKNDRLLQIQRGNLGLYGVGKLRSLKQLEKFVDIKFQHAEGHYTSNHLPTCADLQWVPYSLQGQGTLSTVLSRNLNVEGNKDTREGFHVERRNSFSEALLSASAIDNLYSENGDLDPQPEFSNRKVSRIALSTYYNGPRHSISIYGQSWLSDWNWNDLVIFLALMLLLLAMKK